MENTDLHCVCKRRKKCLQILPFINAAGGDINSLGDTGSIEAVQLIGDMIRSRKRKSKNHMNWSQADVMKQFVAENCNDDQWSMAG